ncbi:hypothetical protein BEWA_017960 [Theileria equi strain WA]|uniref:Uncharacterized protein n=1 Tax=Theileria equi strain WA TaxID=1537102 RepID=L0ATT9_THEEQ|nr:hypothetical protein BEWA_017960 [Theileria equi strain WA]AFZ78955.1 hypothetical protein BEWA_017960 [Theileria equi strain WA]|eukprot:XP_004828621.1 hypothetical protein BEWA_017960 [Theileria equi strain WA]
MNFVPVTRVLLFIYHLVEFVNVAHVMYLLFLRCSEVVRVSVNLRLFNREILYNYKSENCNCNFPLFSVKHSTVYVLGYLRQDYTDWNKSLQFTFHSFIYTHTYALDTHRILPSKSTLCQTTIYKPFVKRFHCHGFISRKGTALNLGRINVLNRFLGYNHGSKKTEVILGGDLNTPPGILKDLDTDECNEFTMDLWNRGLSLPEAIESINSLSPEVDGSVMDNFMYGNATITEDRDYPPGLVDLGEDTDDYVDTYDTDEEGFMELNFGLLSDDEILLVRNIMEEKVNKQNDSYKVQMVDDLVNDKNLSYTREEILRYIEKFDDIATLLINLNRNVDRDPLDIEWIPAVEREICEFVAGKSYTVSTIIWTDGSIDVTIKEEDVSEKKIDVLHDSLFSFIKRLSRKNSFHGLHNLGLMVSGS